MSQKEPSPLTLCAIPNFSAKASAYEPAGASITTSGQDRKDSAQISVTLSGIRTRRSDGQPRKAHSPIPVTPSGIEIS